MNSSASRHPLERVLAVGLRRLLYWVIPLSIGMFLLPAPGPDNGLLLYNLAHLTLLQVATFLFAMEMASLTHEPWFTHTRRPWLASTASLVAAVVGFSALLTLATSAAARYDPSLQFLQLLSSLDIAWVVAALFIGARLLWGAVAQVWSWDRSSFSPASGRSPSIYKPSASPGVAVGWLTPGR